MNKSLFYLLFAALIAFCPVHAKPSRSASIVKVSLNHKNLSGQQKFASLTAPTLETLVVDKRFVLSSKNDYKDKSWYVYNIPICITGQERDKDTKKAATLIDELKVKVYFVYTSKGLKSKDAKDSKGSSKKSDMLEGYRLVEKEITYVNIPLDKVSKKESGGGAEVGYAEMSIGLFIPQTYATLMTADEDPTKVTNSGDLTIVAFAIEPTYAGRTCKRVEVPSVIARGSSEKEKNDNAVSWAVKGGIDPDVTKALNSGSWWKGRAKEHFLKSEVGLMCISETPFAPYYATMYPATKPLYGEPVSTEGSSSGDPMGETSLPGATPASESTTTTSTTIPAGE